MILYSRRQSTNPIRDKWCDIPLTTETLYYTNNILYKVENIFRVKCQTKCLLIPTYYFTNQTYYTFLIYKQYFISIKRYKMV